MKADLSRSTFSPSKHYRDVRWQMGRVPIDADLNEYVDLAAHRVETETIDVVGKCGGPMHNAAFQLATSAAQLPPAQQTAATALGALAPGDFLLSAGRYYVNGLLVENDAPLKFTGQSGADLPGTMPIATSGLYLAYLDVWARHLTYLDDPLIREVALGGPDTATRNRTIWQVKLERVGNTGTPPDCHAAFAGYTARTAPGTGRLAAHVDPNPVSKKPCVLPPGGGYRRLENQLYRVEIHAAGAADGTATFKWSRDNGAIVSDWEATSVPEKIKLRHPPRDAVLGFAVGQWVEVIDDASELKGEPGFLVEISGVAGDVLELQTPPPAGLYTRNPKVRRWDSAGPVNVTAGAWLPLEDGVQVRFSAGTYRTADYWMIPARTATADVEWPQEGGAAAFVPPHGVLHQYCRIGFVDFDGATIKTHDCRRLFPPLTEIDDDCDLKLHNKHLHGKGVVCGLQVNCGRDAKRQTVKVRPGHAIDCEGADLLLASPVTLELVQRAADAKLLDGDGNGEVLVTLKGDTASRPVLDVRAAPPEPSSTAGILEHILEGTLWMDFYEDCLKPVVDNLRKVLLDDDANGPTPVKVQQKRLLALLNLLAHRTGTAPNRRLWLSEEEHHYLRDIYEALVKSAGSSRTFCAIADNFAPFPDYPFKDRAIRTGFVLRRLKGVRAAPSGTTAIAWSENEPGMIHVVDHAKGELLANTQLDGASGLLVQDVAFAHLRGKPAVVVVAADATKTVVNILQPDGMKAITAPMTWSGISLCCLGSDAREPGRVLAIEKGKGVYFLQLDQLSSGAPPKIGWQFDAAGHLAVGHDWAAATVANLDGIPPVPGAYVAVLVFTIRDDILNTTPLSRVQPDVASGVDGLALTETANGLTVHVVVDPPKGRTAKSVLSFDGHKGTSLGLRDLPLADDSSSTGPVAIAADAGSNRIVCALADRNQLVWMPATGGVAPGMLTLPAQGDPVALAFATRSAGGDASLIAANQEGMTLTLITDKELTAGVLTDVEVGAYRDSLLAVGEALVLVLLQQLKDCLCEHLLLDCPECGDDEFLPLARIEIRDGQVYRICNFHRPEVLTFPKVKYWLSAIPVIPLLTYFVEKFCCAVIARSTPQVGGLVGRPEAKATSAFSPQFAVGLASLAKRGTLQASLAQEFTRFKTVVGHLAESTAVQVGRKPSAPVTNRTAISEVVGKDAPSAVAVLVDRGVKVETIESYDRVLKHNDVSADLSKLPSELKAGENVRLFTRGGKVAYYERIPAPEPAPAPVTEPVMEVPRELAETVATLKEQLNETRLAGVAEASKLREANAQLEQQLAATAEKLRAEIQRASGAVASHPPAPAPAAPTGVSADRLQSGLAALRSELAELKATQARELAVRDQALDELRRSSESLVAELKATTTKLQADLTRLGRSRPPKG